MSRTKIKQKKNGRIIQPAVSQESPFAVLQNAILALARAQNQVHRTQRVQAIFELIKAFEASFADAARQVGLAERALIEVTGGEIQAFQLGGGSLPAGTKIRVIDSEGRSAQIVDGQRGRFLKLPAHVEPMAIEIELPSGEKKTIVPGEPVRVSEAKPVCKCGKDPCEPSAHAGWSPSDE